MAETKWTPGEWHVAGNIVRDEYDHDLAQACSERLWEPPVGPMPTEMLIANATVMASAPDLYRALEALEASVGRMVARLDSEPGNQTAVSLWLLQLREARAALAKARGE